MLGRSAPPGPGDWDKATDPPSPGQPLGEVRPLFPRSPASNSKASPNPSAPGGSGTAAAVLSIRVGRIRSVANHPSADKLYVLEVDLGEEAPRTLVAGLRGSYPPEALTGRSVAILANLAPRTIRRMTSQGMVLAADHGDRAVLLEPPASAAPGTFVVGAGPSDRTISYEEFSTFVLRVGSVVGKAEGGGTRVDLGGREVIVSGEWAPDGRVVVRLAGEDATRGELLALGPGQAIRVPAELPPGAKVR